MKKRILTIALSCSLLIVANLWAAEQAPQKVVDLASSTLAKLGSDPVIVSAVKSENAKGKTLEQIKDIDAKWKGTPGIAAFMKPFLENDCATHLHKTQDSVPYYAEIFVMDDKGGNVCQTDKTSDYWQGDEAKFQKSFAGGSGSVFVDEVEFDASTQAYLVQVSVPVIDGGKAIGAITFGIDVDKVE